VRSTSLPSLETCAEMLGQALLLESAGTSCCWSRREVDGQRVERGRNHRMGIQEVATKCHWAEKTRYPGR
jgi:hypothetical protein